jgi:general secretion pathway protein E
MALRRPSVEDLLRRQGAEAGKLKDARRESDRAGVSLIEGAQRVQAVSAESAGRAVAEWLGLPFEATIQIDRIDLELVRKLSLSLAREEGVMPLWIEDGEVRVGIAEPKAMGILEDLRVLYQLPIRAVVLPADVLREATNKSFDKAAQSATEVMEKIQEEDGGGDEGGDLKLDGDILDDPNQAPIIKFVNSLLTQAVKDRASDIHIEPFERELVARFRIDGVLYEIVKPPPRLQASIVSRVKIMSGLNIAEKRIPQDGRIRTRIAGREIDLRVSTLPVRHGERVVMRILEKGRVFNLDQIGMAQETVDQFRIVNDRPPLGAPPCHPHWTLSNRSDRGLQSPDDWQGRYTRY